MLIVDLDPQANASSGLGIDHRNLELGTYEFLLEPESRENIIQEIHGIHVIPASQALAGAAIDLVNIEDREYQLLHALKPLKDQYDFIIIDCPPSLGLLTLNGLVAADKVMIPVQAEYYALEGLSQLLETIQLVQDNLKPELEVFGALITMYDRRAGLSEQVLQELYKHFPNRIFRTVIPRNVRLSEAPSHGLPIMTYSPRSKGARAYEKLAREVISI